MSFTICQSTRLNIPEDPQIQSKKTERWLHVSLQGYGKWYWNDITWLNGNNITWLNGNITWLNGNNITWLNGNNITWFNGNNITWLNGNITWFNGNNITWLNGNNPPVSNYYNTTNVTLESTQPLSEMSTREISWRIQTAGAQDWQPYHLHVKIVLKCGNLNLLEPSGPVQACNWIALPCSTYVFWGAFGKLPKASSCLSNRPSVRPHGTTRFPPDIQN